MKGQLAKEKVKEKIIQIFGNDYIGEFDRKYYVWEKDGNEKVQIAIALTCPKVYRGVEETEVVTSLNFDNDSPSMENQPTKFHPAEITQEEKDTLADLMQKLNL